MRFLIPAKPIARDKENASAPKAIATATTHAKFNTLPSYLA
jgi:hypothetical protein